MVSVITTLRLQGLLVPIALSSEAKDVGMVDKAVNQRRRQPVIPEHLDPSPKLQVRRDDDALVLVGGGDDVEE